MLRDIMISVILVAVMITGFGTIGASFFALYGMDMGNESQFFDTAKNASGLMVTTTKDMENTLEEKEPTQDVEEQVDIYGTLYKMAKDPLAILKPMWSLSNELVQVLGLPSWSFFLSIIFVILLVIILLGFAWRHYI